MYTGSRGSWHKHKVDSLSAVEYQAQMEIYTDDYVWLELTVMIPGSSFHHYLLIPKDTLVSSLRYPSLIEIKK